MRLSFFMFLLLCQCAWRPKLAAFDTDGCSLSPERNVSGDLRWRACCIEHDLAYWKGGTSEERLEADERLRDCILKETGNSRLARAYFEGVRLNGKAKYPTWYRWGYGWNYLRQPGPLSEEEKAMVESRMREVVIEGGECLSCRKAELKSGPPHRR